MTLVTNAPGKIWLAMRNRLNQWTECKVMMPNEIYSPSATQTYVIVQNVGTEYGGPIPIQVECGQPLSGFLNLSVMVPVDFGYDAHIGMAGRVADFFANNAAYTYQDITVRVNGRSRVLGNVSLNAPWNRCEVTVPWIAWG